MRGRKVKKPNEAKKATKDVEDEIDVGNVGLEIESTGRGE